MLTFIILVTKIKDYCCIMCTELQRLFKAAANSMYFLPCLLCIHMYNLPNLHKSTRNKLILKGHTVNP